MYGLAGGRAALASCCRTAALGCRNARRAPGCTSLHKVRPLTGTRLQSWARDQRWPKHRSGHLGRGAAARGSSGAREPGPARRTHRTPRQPGDCGCTTMRAPQSVAHHNGRCCTGRSTPARSGARPLNEATLFETLPDWPRGHPQRLIAPRRPHPSNTLSSTPPVHHDTRSPGSVSSPAVASSMQHRIPLPVRVPRCAGATLRWCFQFLSHARPGLGARVGAVAHSVHSARSMHA